MSEPDVHGTAWLPHDMPLDPRAVFPARELESRGIHLTAEQQEWHHDNGGRLPDGIALNDDQRKGLVVAHVLAANGWSASTTVRVVRRIAQWLKIHVVLVAENGTVELDVNGWAGAGPGSRSVLYRQGGDWVAALPAPPVGGAQAAVRRRP